MTINQDIFIAAQFSNDGKGFKRENNTHRPWFSATEFLTEITLPVRHVGMTAWIVNGSEYELWHFVGGIGDDKLVKYSLASVTSIVTEISNDEDRKSTRLNSSHPSISYAVFCLKKK